MKPTSIPLFLTPRQLAIRWGIHPITLRRWRREGKITASHFGRGIRFSADEVARFESEARA
jgi:excisionase family DNA binding protein